MAAEPQPMRRSLCARILAAGRDDIVRFSPGTQRDMQSRLWESGLSFSNTERVELCTVWACRQRNRWWRGGGRQPVWWTHSTHFIDLGFPPEMLIGFEMAPKKLIGFQIGHRFSMMITVVPVGLTKTCKNSLLFRPNVDLFWQLDIHSILCRM